MDQHRHAERRGLREEGFEARIGDGGAVHVAADLDTGEAERLEAAQLGERRRQGLQRHGLVVAEDQRGFAVPGISAEELIELTRTRCWLEERGLRESMAAATEAWEDAVLLAGHRLARTPRTPDGDITASWEARHRDFHRVLIARCGSRWPIGFCEQLTDRHRRYRRLAAKRGYPERDVQAEHAAILEAVLARDVEQAVARLTEHYQRTAAVILADETLFGPPGQAGERASIPEASV